MQHLYHFCATLPSDPYVETKPIFTFSESGEDGSVNAITAKVVLPNSVDPLVREACGQSKWRTEKFAKRDAAFEAYIALYHVGLVSDHLLPIKGVDEAAAAAHTAVAKIASLVEAPGQLDPWVDVSHQWQDAANLHTSTIMIDHDGEAISEMTILLPRPLPSISKFELYWDHNVSFTTTISMSFPIRLDKDYISSASDVTDLLLSSIFRSRMDGNQSDFVALFVIPDTRDLGAWISPFLGTVPADTLLEATASSKIGIVRDVKDRGKPHMFRGISQEQLEVSGSPGGCTMVIDSETAPNAGYLEVTKLSKRADFLHAIPSPDQITGVGPASRYLPTSDCEVDNLPFTYSRFAMFVPSIMHQVEIALVAEHLCKTLMHPVHFEDFSLVETAISASAARERSNYQSMEFLVRLTQISV